ncbi:hypothetical protein CK203_032917 [Vitis vinifera]|uniref:Uncharacterized protein n=1 Tax=Vitis vinifera TaxID=29760 RepID=A0A438HL08_VITVI|nr:hypothetical protein CK203_032917 [Vitis vinifera]
MLRRISQMAFQPLGAICFWQPLQPKRLLQDVMTEFVETREVPSVMELQLIAQAFHLDGMMKKVEGIAWNSIRPENSFKYKVKYLPSWSKLSEMTLKVRLDVATILGLLAFFINYKFEDILSSPSAILLDVIAVSALIIYVTRVALGYKQTWDRTLYEKTLASGFGSVHFLLDASEQQQYKEAILAYAILLKAEKGQATCRKSLGDECERFMYNVFKQKVEMPVDKAADTLLRLGLVTETPINGRMGLQAVPCPKACQALKQRWNSLLK